MKKVPEIVNAILEETGTDREAVQHYLLHQANIRILEAASRRPKVPMDKIPVNIETLRQYVGGFDSDSPG